MFSWANRQLERLSETLAPPPLDPNTGDVSSSHRYLSAIQSGVGGGGGGEEIALSVLRDGALDPYTHLNARRMNALHVASSGCALSVIRELLSNTTMDVNVADVDGNTPLHHAATSTPPPPNASASSISSLDGVRVLIEEYGADVLRRNHAGMTPYDVASTQSVRGYLLPKQLQAENASGLVVYPPGVAGGGFVGGESMMGMGGPPPPPLPPPTSMTGADRDTSANGPYDPVAALMRPTAGALVTATRGGNYPSMPPTTMPTTPSTMMAMPSPSSTSTWQRPPSHSQWEPPQQQQQQQQQPAAEDEIQPMNENHPQPMAEQQHHYQEPTTSDQRPQFQGPTTDPRPDDAATTSMTASGGGGGLVAGEDDRNRQHGTRTMGRFVAPPFVSIGGGPTTALPPPPPRRDSPGGPPQPRTTAASAPASAERSFSGYALRGGGANAAAAILSTTSPSSGGVGVGGGPGGYGVRRLYKPDGFHSSSNDRELQAKYGHVTNEHEVRRTMSVGPPPRSGECGVGIIGGDGGVTAGTVNPYSASSSRYPSHYSSAPSSYGSGGGGGGYDSNHRAVSAVPAYATFPPPPPSSSG